MALPHKNSIVFMIVDLRLLIEKSPKIKRIPDQKTKNII